MSAQRCPRNVSETLAASCPSSNSAVTCSYIITAESSEAFRSALTGRHVQAMCAGRRRRWHWGYADGHGDRFCCSCASGCSGAVYRALRPGVISRSNQQRFEPVSADWRHLCRDAAGCDSTSEILVLDLAAASLHMAPDSSTVIVRAEHTRVQCHVPYLLEGGRCLHSHRRLASNNHHSRITSRSRAIHEPPFPRGK